MRGRLGLATVAAGIVLVVLAATQLAQGSSDSSASGRIAALEAKVRVLETKQACFLRSYLGATRAGGDATGGYEYSYFGHNIIRPALAPAPLEPFQRAPYRLALVNPHCRWRAR